MRAKRLTIDELPNETELDQLLVETLKAVTPLDERIRRLYDRPYCNRGWVQVYTDGSCFNNGLPTAHAGAGVYFGPGNTKNAALRVPGPGQTNNRGELYAILESLRIVERHHGLEIYTDSKYAIEMITILAPAAATVDWDVPNGDVLRAIAEEIKSRPSPVTLKQVKGHSGNAHNDAADELAKVGA
ncbi:ribonuclease H-like domain-containing protein, partial [Ephemerocybe angulata]